MTRSPTRRPWTSSPSSSTTPMNSCPIRRGSRTAGSPRYGHRSDPQMQLARTRTTASRGPSSFGSGACSRRTSWGPCSTVAFTLSSFRHPDVLPERDPPGDLLRRVLGLRVVPHRVLALLAVELQGVVRRGALPGAEGVRVRGTDDVVAQGVPWKVVVALDDDRVVALGDGHALPDGPHRSAPCAVGVSSS